MWSIQSFSTWACLVVALSQSAPALASDSVFFHCLALTPAISSPTLCHARLSSGFLPVFPVPTSPDYDLPALSAPGNHLNLEALHLVSYELRYMNRQTTSYWPANTTTFVVQYRWASSPKTAVPTQQVANVHCLTRWKTRKNTWDSLKPYRDKNVAPSGLAVNCRATLSLDAKLPKLRDGVTMKQKRRQALVWVSK